MEINITEFKNALRDREVSFKYLKKDGSERTAKGTLNMDIYGEDNKPKGTGYEASDNVIRYYDTNSNGWRSFLVENLIEWDK